MTEENGEGRRKGRLKDGRKIWGRKQGSEKESGCGDKVRERG